MKKGLFVVLLAACLFQASKPVQAQDWIYFAKDGDTLWDLCLEYTAKPGCWKALGEYNGVDNARRLPIGTELKIPLAWLVRLPVVGKVSAVTAAVFYEESAGGDRVPLVAGQSLVLGSRIISESGTARVVLGRGDTILIRPASMLELNAMTGPAAVGEKSELRLENGEVQVEVEPDSDSKFEIHTPSAIAAVRGTQFRVATQGAAGEATRSEILEGVVAVQAATTKDVPAGFGLLAQRGQPLSEPRKLIAAPVFEQSPLGAPLPITVRWTGDGTAAAWNLDLFSQNADGALLRSVSSATMEYEFTGLESGCYHLRVRAVDAEGFNGLDGELPLCVEPPPPVVEEPRSYWDFVIWAAIATLMLL